MFVILPLASLLGLGLFAWPFLGLGLPPETPALAVALGTFFALLLVGIATHRLDNRQLALLVSVAALDAALRLALVQGIAGFSPVFFLILCVGYVFGPSFGFLAGSLTLLVSAIATGGVGPWIPYEMFALGWVGAIAGLFQRKDATVRRRDLLLLAGVGFILGYLYGAVTDIWDWSTFWRGAADFGWVPGMTPATAASRFLRFYLVTSAWFDTPRAIGNAIMVLALGTPVIAALTRFRARFTLTVLAPPPNRLGTEFARPS